MSVARKVTKQDLELLSDLTFKSYTTQEFELGGYHFVLRSLTTQEREDIHRKYAYLSNKHNMKLVLEILSNAMLYINGCEFVLPKHKKIFYDINARVILKIFTEYQKLDSMVAESSKFVDYFIETRESRNMWSIFKTCSRIPNPFDIRHFNQYQFYWIVSNASRDAFEEEKHNWAKVEYMTNSICAFLNPKAFRKAKGQMGVVEQLENQENHEKRRLVEELEFGKKQEVVETNDVFSSMERLEDESDEEYEYRVNTLMERTLKGELVDEHDRLVRESEINFLKKFLREKRTQVLVEREIYSRKGIQFDSTEVLENEALKIQLEEDKKLGFVHDDFSYIEIISMKDFVAVSRKEKKEAFDEAMNEEINLDEEVNRFLKSLSDSNNISDEELKVLLKEPDTIGEQTENASEGETDSRYIQDDILKTAAEKVSHMNVNVKGVDLLKQKEEKMRNAIRALNRRKIQKPDEEDQDLDVMKFE